MPHKRSSTNRINPGRAKHRPRSRAVELTLTRSDIDAMPPELRHPLLYYFETRFRSRRRRLERSRVAGSKAAASQFDRQQVVALLRSISFHRLGRSLRRLLDRLSEAGNGAPLTRSKLAAALPVRERKQVGRYMAVLNRLAAKAAKKPGIHFCRFIRSKGVYSIHPTTRQWLRDILPGIERAGANEEPLWE